MTRSAVCLLVLLAVFCGVGFVRAEETPFAGRAAMNGYSLDQFGDFLKEWRFVTVRYRKDTGEIRFTYANDAAWKALQAGGTDYPDGAVFAKVGVVAGEDAAFSSSVVPSGAKRFQFMVRDAKKHADTDGWGYALFNMEGKTFDEDPVIKTQACAACHRIVPERQYVFSQILHLGPRVPAMDSTEGLPENKLSFLTEKIASVSAFVRANIPRQFAEMRVLQGELRSNLFQGTLDEIRPALIKEVVRSGIPAGLVDTKGERFSIVTPDLKRGSCKLGDGSEGLALMGIFTQSSKQNGQYQVDILNTCAAK